MSARSNPTGRPDPAKHSLKDRASKAEASAARVFGRAKPNAEPKAAEPSVFALRDQWRAACATVNAGGHSDAEVDRLAGIAFAAEEALIAAPVQTAAELACKVEALRQHIGASSLDTGLPHDTILAICRGVELLAYTPKASRHPSATPAGAPAADPILQAIDDHRAAFDAANAQPTDELSEKAFWRWQEVYKALQALTPITPEGICALAAHLRQFLKDGQNEIGTTFVDEAFTVLLNAIDRFSAAGVSASAPPPEVHDLSGIDSEALAHLCDVFEAIETRWDAVSCQPVIEGARNGYISATSLAHAESKRAERARRRVMDEIRSRQPRTEEERDTLLSARIKDELLREGQIMDRDLLLEAVKAWG